MAWVPREDSVERLARIGAPVFLQEQLTHEDLRLEVVGIGHNRLVIRAQGVLVELMVVNAEVAHGSRDRRQLF